MRRVVVHVADLWNHHDLREVLDRLLVLVVGHVGLDKLQVVVGKDPCQVVDPVLHVAGGGLVRHAIGHVGVFLEHVLELLRDRRCESVVGRRW